MRFFQYEEEPPSPCRKFSVFCFWIEDIYHGYCGIILHLCSVIRYRNYFILEVLC